MHRFAAFLQTIENAHDICTVYVQRFEGFPVARNAIDESFIERIESIFTEIFQPSRSGSEGNPHFMINLDVANRAIDLTSGLIQQLNIFMDDTDAPMGIHGNGTTVSQASTSDQHPSSTSKLCTRVKTGVECKFLLYWFHCVELAIFSEICVYGETAKTCPWDITVSDCLLHHHSIAHEFIHSQLLSRWYSTRDRLFDRMWFDWLRPNGYQNDAEKHSCLREAFTLLRWGGPCWCWSQNDFSGEVGRIQQHWAVIEHWRICETEFIDSARRHRSCDGGTCGILSFTRIPQNWSVAALQIERKGLVVYFFR